MNRSHFLLPVALLMSLPAFGQPSGSSDPGEFRSEARLQAFVFDNFFQASESALEQDVSALGTELRSAFQPAQVPFEMYGHVNYLHWDETDRKNSYGGRLGFAHDGEIHDFNVFVGGAFNRASVDIGDVVTTADVTTAAGEYSYRLGDWQLGAEGMVEDYRFDDFAEQDGDYTSVGASVRYRGFGWKFSPRVGFTTTRLSMGESNESYKEPAWYAQLVFVPHPRVYASIRYRDRDRSYSTTDPGDSNFGRKDDRPEWSSYGSVRLTERFSGTWYYSSQDVTSSRAGRDFDSSLLIFGLLMRL